MSDLATRIRAARDRLVAATESLTVALGDVEEALFEKLGERAFGRVNLRTRPSVTENLVLKDGYLWIEVIRPRRRDTWVPIRNASREQRVLASDHVRDLWYAAGGYQLPSPV